MQGAHTDDDVRRPRHSIRTEAVARGARRRQSPNAPPQTDPRRQVAFLVALETGGVPDRAHERDRGRLAAAPALAPHLLSLVSLSVRARQNERAPSRAAPRAPLGLHCTPRLYICRLSLRINFAIRLPIPFYVYVSVRAWITAAVDGFCLLCR